jgi:hypothetical protein
MTGVIRGLPLWLLITFALTLCANAQTATYHVRSQPTTSSTISMTDTDRMKVENRETRLKQSCRQ